ncbi:MAG: porin family protein [Gammaproteobacteria bacterium]|nr:porin family protein [Gammaproteobacteria bacterium]
MKQTRIALLLSLAMCPLVSAQAAMPLPAGWYLEGNVGEANVSNVDYASNSTNNNSGIAWNANVGYKFMPFFAFEGGYSTYGNTNVESYNTKVAKATSQTYDIAGKVMLPIQNSGFEFLAKLGIGRTRTHITESNPNYVTAHGITVNAGTNLATSVIYGLGGEYSFSPNMLVNAQWMRADGGDHTGNLDLYLIGVSYLFG